MIRLLAVKSGADVVVIDGDAGRHSCDARSLSSKNVGIPDARRGPARGAGRLQELGMHRKVQLIVSGRHSQWRRRGQGPLATRRRRRRHRHGGRLIALGDNNPNLEAEYQALGTTARRLR